MQQHVQRLLPASTDEAAPTSAPRPAPSSARYTFVVMCNLGLALVYAMRCNLSVAAQSMQDQFGWSEPTKGWVLSAFFVGYFFGQVPGGWLATRYGGKWVFGVGVLVTAVLTLALPVATCGTLLCPLNTTNATNASSLASWTEPAHAHESSNLTALVLVRILMGLCEGTTFPALYALFAKWVPPAERSRMVAWTLVGCQLGTIVAFPVSGWIASIVPAPGAGLVVYLERWPGVFYIFGSAGVLWFAMFCATVYSSPADHPRIAAAERRYIEVAIGPAAETRVPPSLYLTLLTNRHSLAIFIGHATCNWAFYLMLTAMPMYVEKMLGFDLENAGVLSVAPYLGYTCLATAAAPIADRLIPTHGRRRVRIGVQLLASLLPAALFIILGYTSDVAAAVALLTLAVSVSGINGSGFGANVLDICPRYSGILFSLSNTLATIPGIVAPLVTGAIVQDPPKMSQWQEVFYIAAAIFLFGFVVFARWSAGEPVAALNPDPPERDGTRGAAPSGRGGHVHDGRSSIKPTP
jgi:MFS family permease